ncbi:hypothetical protein T439DRAFT_381790 [Meredithblackwellia eburnea MCA 4105]
MSQIATLSELIQDLLSPSTISLPSTTPALISYHLAITTPPAPALPLLVQSILTSPSLWKGDQLQFPAYSTSINLERAKQVFDAIANGVQYRRGEIVKSLDGATGWRARRQYSAFVQALLLEGTTGEANPTIKLLVTSAVLAGLQAIKANKDKVYVGGSGLLGVAEDRVLQAWDEYFQLVQPTNGAQADGRKRARGEDTEDRVPAWIAAMTLHSFPVEKLKKGPVSALLSTLTYSFSSVFSHGTLFESLSSDLVRVPSSSSTSASTTTSGKIHWNIPSPSHTTLTRTLASPLFPLLGPLSRALGRTLEAAGTPPVSPSSTQSIQETLNALERLAVRVQREWGSSTWSDVKDPAPTPSSNATPTISTSSSDESALSLDEETSTHKEPWTILKSLLFSYTLVLSSLLNVLSPSPITILKVRLAGQGMRVLGRLYFVTVKFGNEGFGAWKSVWEGLGEVLRDVESGAGGGVGEGRDVEVGKLMRELRPVDVGKPHHREVERSTATFYLNCAELLMTQLPDPLIEDPLLTCCRPYLDNATYRETFESAHSVLLALFARGRNCASELAPWYTALLLQAYPTLMTTSQLRLSFTTMVRCVSNSDDALAWYIVQQLLDAIERLPVSRPSSSISFSSSTTISDNNTPTTTTSASLDPTPTTRLDEANSLSPLETQALSLPRGHLLLTLIDQLTSVNLVLLRTLLDKIWLLIDEEPDNEGKGAVVEILFGTLGEGLDSIKKEEGVRFWLEKGVELLYLNGSGMSGEEVPVEPQDTESAPPPAQVLPKSPRTTCATCSKTATTSGGKLQLCSRCELQAYCSSTCQTSDWKRHKQEECNPWRDAADDLKATLPSFVNTRVDFVKAAKQWSKFWSSEMTYAARCSLKPNLPGDLSATHTFVATWDYQQKQPLPRRQFKLNSVLTLTHKEAGQLMSQMGLDDPEFEYGLSPEGVVKKHNWIPTNQRPSMPLTVLSVFKLTENLRWSSREHLTHGLSILTHVKAQLNLVDEDWEAVLRKSLDGEMMPTDADLLVAQMKRRADGGLAEAIAQGFSDENGEYIEGGGPTRHPEPQPPNGPPEGSTKKKKKKRKKKKSKTAGSTQAEDLSPQDNGEQNVLESGDEGSEDEK